MKKSPGNRKDRMILILILLSGSVFIYFFMPWINLHPVPCIHREITGIGCPLCGMTHAVYELLHLRIRTAVIYNPAIVIMAIWFGTECLLLINPSDLYLKIRTVTLFALIASLCLVYVFRILRIL